MTTSIAVGEKGTPSDGRPIVVGSRIRLMDSYGVAEFIMVAGGVAEMAVGRHISVKSPLGRSLLGHRAGERVEIQTPLGVQVVRILDVL